MNFAQYGLRISRFGLLSFRQLTASSLRGGAPPLINGQHNKCRLEEWRGNAVFRPTFYEIPKNTVHFDGCLFFSVTIHRGGQRRTGCSEFSALFGQERFRKRITTSAGDCSAFTKQRER